MKININSPEIAAFRKPVEQKFGCPIRAPRHFAALSFDIGERHKEYLSATTLQRLWLYKTGYDTVAIHTLNVLSLYSGYRDWEQFCKAIKNSSPIESEMFEGKVIKVDSLEVGTVIKIGWMPDRLCLIKYLGNFRFEAIETHNSKLSKGDTFTCTQMQLGRELCLDNLVRGTSDMSYVVGNRNGLTTLEVVKKLIAILF